MARTKTAPPSRRVIAARPSPAIGTILFRIRETQAGVLPPETVEAAGLTILTVAVGDRMPPDEGDQIVTGAS